MTLAWAALLGGLALGAYSYALYPAALGMIALGRRRPPLRPQGDDELPVVTITVPVYNEAHQIRETLESLLALDYPRDRLQILIVSDASGDGTDEIVRSYAGRGIELLRMPERRGKTAAENAAGRHLRGEIVLNTDASIRIRPDALKALIRTFADPTVGVASGRDVSVSGSADGNRGEAGYVGYEMWVRALETRVESIIGASGCFYAIRRPLHLKPLPEQLSRDFAAALHAREAGYRAVTVPEAVCLVPRVGSISGEYGRKVRTIVRGMQTLAYKRHLMNPFRHGLFAWMLFSHKVCRWLVPWGAAVALAGLAALATGSVWAAAVLACAVVGIAVGALGWAQVGPRRLARIMAVPAFLLMGNVAAMTAAVRAVGGAKAALWEPTRRTVEPAG